ncbi:enoyl-CoA hydratase/isomerase family protein [Leucobacter triazinivorans]|uniref:3-hydroxyisobutyryl-CoA hydrolase n=1 Tax=Leucobacter triazinivorans TaxID=1784719 RepID=A0A4P6KCA3_9MICO|nr:enoyl-CoA hydratase/isomerase family protein [Leucobacter triazinivorans]QBE47792.1 enoyl-CoA hydratase/isomerase family protein [Leucobacter triazinivorans]
MSHDAHPAPAEPLVLSRREGPITRITLNRPRAINALNLEMFELLEAALETAWGDGSTAILLDGAGERGFCGGGDIKQLSGPHGREILAVEYRVDHMIAVSPIPVVGCMDGVTMGGGIGLTGHASHRVVTERSRLAMPEARIGITPDVGGHLLLARAPGRLGELLAITAGEMDAGDAIALGFADHFVPSERLGDLRAALAAGEDPGSACARFADPAPESSLLAARDWWDPIAAGALDGTSAPVAEDSAGAARRLVRALEASDAEPARAAAETARRMCPTSIAVTLAQLDRTRRLGLDLASVLSDDLRVLGRLAPRPDFAEGVRAQVIDKDRDPRWSPARIEELDPAELAAILAPDLAAEETPLVLR